MITFTGAPAGAAEGIHKVSSAYTIISHPTSGHLRCEFSIFFFYSFILGIFYATRQIGLKRFFIRSKRFTKIKQKRFDREADRLPRTRYRMRYY